MFIYRGCFTWKNLWEEKFTLGEFTPVNMKKIGRHNVRKHREIKNGERYITLDILLEFGSMDKMKITSSDPKYYLGRSGKGLNSSLVINTIGRSNKSKNSRFAMTNASPKDISKIIKDFEKFPYKGYVWKRPKYERTDNYFYQSR